MALAALGEVDSVRRRLAEWEATPEHEGLAGTRAYIAGLELMAHGHEREGREILAGTLPFYRRLRETAEWPGNDTEVKVLMWTGQLEEAQRVARAALQATPPGDSLAYLTHLGEIAALQGNQAEAARYDRLLAAERRPELAAQATGDRALIASLLGDREGAVRLLEQALARGDGESGFLGVHRDPNLAPLRGYAPFERFLEPRE
jgi:tetratricopeptide (TPR) repeat protein